MISAFYGGIEAGGTKFICAVGTSPGDLRAETQFPTTTPIEVTRHHIPFLPQYVADASTSHDLLPHE